YLYQMCPDGSLAAYDVACPKAPPPDIKKLRDILFPTGWNVALVAICAFIGSLMRAFYTLDPHPKTIAEFRRRAFSPVLHLAIDPALGLLVFLGLYLLAVMTQLSILQEPKVLQTSFVVGAIVIGGLAGILGLPFVYAVFHYLGV